MGFDGRVSFVDLGQPKREIEKGMFSHYRHLRKIELGCPDKIRIVVSQVRLSWEDISEIIGFNAKTRIVSHPNSHEYISEWISSICHCQMYAKSEDFVVDDGTSFSTLLCPNFHHHILNRISGVMSVIKVCKEIILSSWPAARVVDWDGMGWVIARG